VLHELLPPQSVASHNYNLRPRKHHFVLRVIFILFHSSMHLSFSHTLKYYTLCVLTEFNKIHDDDDDAQVT